MAVFFVVEIDVALGHRFEGSAFEFWDLLQPEFIDCVGHEEDFEAAGFEAFDLGGVFDVIDALAGDVVDVVLVVIHALDVIGEGCEGFAVIVCGIEAADFEDILAVGVGVVEAFFDRGAELSPEGDKAGFVVFGHFGEVFEDARRDAGADFLQDWVMLQIFAADI